MASEDEVGRKWDRCMTNVLTNTAIGVGFGALFSLVLFKRKSWPVYFGAGVGVGNSFSECQFDFSHPGLFHGRRVKIADAKEAAPAPAKSE